jgi:hypothetical protein
MRLAILLPFLLAANLPAQGPLRIHPDNPRYFTDNSKRAIVLSGSHVWQNLQDNGLLIRGATGNPPPVFNYPQYLSRLSAYGHNFFRLWRWETTKWTDNYNDGRVKYAANHPWLRTGPDAALDGAPRFDLEKFDPAYFSRLRQRVQMAGQLGIYVSVMLFEGWEIQFTDGWRHHPFHAPNNVNGVEADANGDGLALEFNTLQSTAAGKRVLALQEAYVRQVVEAVGDLDNVLYEIANEAHGDSTAWQYHMIRFVKELEKTRPKQHPVGMTFQYKGGTNQILHDSPADWISPNPGNEKESYRTNPCAGCTSKIVVSDTDHIWGHTGGDNVWVWKTFTRGLHPLFMEEMLPSPTWQDSARTAMGQVQRFARRIDLAAMKPEGGLSATGYCLAARGREYLVFQHDKGEFTLDLKDAPGDFDVEWMDINQNRLIMAGRTQGGAVQTFTTPFPGPAALYLRKR